VTEEEAVATTRVAKGKRQLDASSTGRKKAAGAVLASRGSGKSHAILAELAELPIERQRFALFLVDALRSVADESDMREADVRNLVFRLVQAGLLQERRAPEARGELARALGPALSDMDPVPYATVEQARRLSTLRASLLRSGALSTGAVAESRGMTPNNARQWISRNRRAHRLFTVTYEGETLLPAFLLDEEFAPKPEAQAPIRALREAGEDGWALWAWFATPSAWLGGKVPAELLATDPGLVAESARQRSASAA
jgi:hypothetical protein